MKKLYLIGGTMGVGKTTVSRLLKQRLNQSVFLDGDWCWDANPFQVTDETKEMVLDNICHLLNNFLHCSAYEHIIFCWVMHEQAIIDSILSRLDRQNCLTKCISLMIHENALRERLNKDIEKGIRSDDVMARSIARLPCYEKLNTLKIDTTDKPIALIADEIIAL